MSETKEAQSAGQLIGALAPNAVKACLRLASLERNWGSVAERVVTDRTQLQSCSFAKDGLHIVVNVPDSGAMNSLKFRKARLENSVASYLNVQTVHIEFRVGRVEKRRAAKNPLPDCQRRAPVLLGEDAIERQKRELGCRNGDEVTEALARLKAVSERLHERRKR